MRDLNHKSRRSVCLHVYSSFVCQHFLVFFSYAALGKLPGVKVYLVIHPWRIWSAKVLWKLYGFCKWNGNLVFTELRIFCLHFIFLLSLLVRFILRPTVNRPVCQANLRARDKYFFSIEIFLRQIFFYYYSYIVWRRAREPILPVTGYFYIKLFTSSFNSDFI
jgi:hypothetical protein